MRVHRTRAWLLTINDSLEVDMSSNRHMPDGARRKFDPEDQRVVVHFSLGHQHALTVMRSYETKMQEAAIQNINPDNNAQFRDTKTARVERTLG